MQDLLATIQAKSQEVTKVHQATSKKYLSRKERDALERKRQREKNVVPAEKTSGTSSNQQHKPTNPSTTAESRKRARTFTSSEVALPRDEVYRRLRQKRQPVTLFGETDEDRYQRLLKLEASNDAAHTEDFALQGSHGMRNTFLAQDDEAVTNHLKESKASREADVAKNSEPSNDNKVGTTSKPKNNEPEQVIREWIKARLDEWATELSERSLAAKSTAKGKIDTKTFKQCKDYIRPLLKLLKVRQVEPDIVSHVHQIVLLCNQREYRQAADWYLKLAIGNSPWPIGVTMVGIHERTGRERINASKVAHVMNDEAQRKYITSLKRLMTFAQQKYPTNPSRMMLNN